MMAGRSTPETTQIQLLSQIRRLLADARHQNAIVIQQMEQRLANLYQLKSSQPRNLAQQITLQGKQGSSSSSPSDQALGISAGNASSIPAPPPAPPNRMACSATESLGFSVNEGNQSQSFRPIPLASSTANGAISGFPQSGVPNPSTNSPISPVGPPESRTITTQDRPPKESSSATASLTHSGRAHSPPPTVNRTCSALSPLKNGFQVLNCPECSAKVGIYFEIYHLPQTE